MRNAAYRMALVSACVIGTACIPPRVLPKQTGKSDARPHPTREKLQALMADASDYVPDPINEITLSAHPQRVFPGGYVWASCVVPRHYVQESALFITTEQRDNLNSRIEVRGNGQAWNNPLDSQQNRFLLGPLPCGGVEIRCTVTTFRGVEHRRVQLETGECGG